MGSSSLDRVAVEPARAVLWGPDTTVTAGRSIAQVIAQVEDGHQRCVLPALAAFVVSCWVLAEANSGSLVGGGVEPSVSVDDVGGAFGEVGGGAVVGAVADVVAEVLVGLLVVALGVLCGGEVQAGDLLIRRGAECGLGCRAGRGWVSFCEVVGGEGVGDVDDGGCPVVLQGCVGEPGVSAG